tara:strand:- start:65 stop:205 length:141 start_codon:yes stop_codon:yes gene_type:complete
MDATKLEKLAEIIRQYAKDLEVEKQQKIASITIASTGLELLRRKLQ